MNDRERAIVHLDLDAFFVAVERVVDPALRGYPVVVAFGAGRSSRAVAASVSYEARAAGVTAGMNLGRARRLCPDAYILPGNPDLYARASRAFFHLLHDFSPLVEPAGHDQAYLDLSGTGRLLGAAADVGRRLQRAVRDRLRLEVSVGLGGSKLLSKVAAGCARPTGFCDVSPGWEGAFLRPLRVRRLPGVGAITERRLLDFNLRCCGEVADVPGHWLERAFGAAGRLLGERARGIDRAPVQPRGPVGEVGAETTLPVDTNDPTALQAVVRRLVEQAGGRLRARSRLAHTVILRLSFADGRESVRRQALPGGTDLDQQIAPVASALAAHLLQRRVRVRRVSVRLSGLTGGLEQGDLFDARGGGAGWAPVRALTGAMDRVRSRWGFDAIGSARALPAGPGTPSDRRRIDRPCGLHI